MAKETSINIKNRMAVILLTFGFCAFFGMAQKSIPERLNYALENQDMESGLRLYNEITNDDLKQLSDSVLFDYHYLGGYINSEIPNHEKAIFHLLEAKKLCDTTLGTHSGVYMEIVRGLGDEYAEMGRYEEALGIYQEGIVKSSYMRVAASRDFGNLIMGVQQCYERLGWFNEIPRHLTDAWSFWDKDEKPLVTYTYYPLWTLQQFYRRYEMYDKALQVSDSIISFITEKGGSNHPELAEALYNKANTLVDMGKSKDAIRVFRQGMSILEGNKMEVSNETYGMIMGNLLMALVSSNKTDDVHIILKDIKDYGKRTNNPSFYKNALFSAVKRYNTIGDYTQALSLSKVLSGLDFTEQEKEILAKLTNEIEYNNEITSSLPQLESQFTSLTKGSPEWFDIAHKLSNAYYLNKRLENNHEVLKSMYETCIANPVAGSDYLFWVLINLYGNALESERFNDALTYANSRLQYLSSMPDAPEDYVFYAVNDIVVAKLKSKQLTDIDADLDRAISLCTKVFGKGTSNYGICLHNKGRAYQLSGKLIEAKQLYLEAIALQTKEAGYSTNRTVQYLMETERQITDEELDL